MSATIFRTSALARSALRAGMPKRITAAASTSFIRGKATLPDLPYDYAALEPSISGKIMEIHHKNHHQTYVTGLNTALESAATANQNGDVKATVALQKAINFFGGGHINHSLFWENLAPANNGGGGEPSGALKSAIESSYSDFSSFKTQFNAALAGIQGSGWAWLVLDSKTGAVDIKSYANQDPVVTPYVPLLGIDAWEHAYYLQYQNRKAEYFTAIWDVINWKTVEERYTAAKK